MCALEVAWARMRTHAARGACRAALRARANNAPIPLRKPGSIVLLPLPSFIEQVFRVSDMPGQRNKYGSLTRKCRKLARTLVPGTW